MKYSFDGKTNKDSTQTQNFNLVYPSCGSDKVVKNGHIHNGKQNHKCKDCGRQFVENLEKNQITQLIKETIDKLLLERISLGGYVE